MMRTTICWSFALVTALALALPLPLRAGALRLAPNTNATAPAGAGGGSTTPSPSHDLGEVVHRQQEERVEQLKRWKRQESSLAALTGAAACHQELLENRAEHRREEPSLPVPTVAALRLSSPSGLDAKDPLLNLVEDPIAKRAVPAGDYDEMTKALGQVRQALATVEARRAEAEQAVAKLVGRSKKRLKKTTKQLEVLQKLEGEMKAMRDALVNDLRRLDHYLTGQVRVPILSAKALPRARTAALRETARRYDCSATDRLCLTFDGVPLGTREGLELEPGFIGRVEAKSRITVLVFADLAVHQDVDKSSLSLKMGAIEHNSDLARALPPAKSKGTHSGTSACEVLPTQVGHVLVGSEVLRVPDDTTKRFGVVEFERKDAKGAVKTRAQHPVRIEHGRYYVDVGLLVPFAPRGQQQLTLANDNGAQRVALDQSLHVTGALALNVFPFGRRKDALSPFDDLRCDSRLRDDERKRCRQRAWGRPFAELFGLQVGADFNADLLDQIYVGGVFEPLTGLSFSTGVAILEVPDLPPGVTEGYLVIADTDIEAIPRRQARWYGGFTLSLDIIRFVQNARARFKEQKP